MKAPLFALFTLALLAGCNNSPELRRTLSTLRDAPLQLFGPTQVVDPAAEGPLRALLEADGKPAIQVLAPGQRYAALMVPYYPGKEGAMTWTSVTYETLTLRDGVVIASRGLGADLMAARAPTAAQIRSGQGSFHRIYEYLGPNDMAESFDFDCDFAVEGAQTITVLTRPYQTTRISETCFKGENRFQNVYWVDQGGNIRQSSQVLVPDKLPMLLQRIID